MSDEQNPQQPRFMPLPPPPVAAPTASPPGATVEAPPRRRKTGLIVGAIVVALALLGGLIAFNAIGGDKGSASAQPLALVFTQGQTETYTIHMTMDGKMDAGEMLGGSQPIVMDVSEKVTWEVASVDADGVATVNVTVDEMTGTLNGIAIPDAAPSTPSVQMQIAPDGRILSAGGMSFADQTGGAGFPGMGQMTPLLPDGPVQPGDTWTKDFSQDVPFGEGTIEFTSTSTLERYEDVDGVNAAVVTTEYTVPMDFTIDFGKLLDAMAGTEGMPTGATGLAGAQIAYGGSGKIHQTAWVDPEEKQMLKMTSTGSFDMTMAFTGLDVFEGQTIGFTGDFTEDLTRG